MKSWEIGCQTISRRVISRRSLLSIALLIALSLGASPRASAQVECLGVCEEKFAQCLRNGGSFRASCLETFEACVDACLGGSTAIFD